MDRQIENQVRMQLRDLAGRGVDPSTSSWIGRR